SLGIEYEPFSSGTEDHRPEAVFVQVPGWLRGLLPADYSRPDMSRLTFSVSRRMKPAPATSREPWEPSLRTLTDPACGLLPRQRQVRRGRCGTARQADP